jgi:hypothetical protein
MFYIANYKVVYGTICEISTSLCSREYNIETIIYYTLKRGGMYKDDKVEERYLYPTKEELLKSL